MFTRHIARSGASAHAVMLSATIASSFFAVQAIAAAPQPSTEIPESLRFALQRDLGVMPGQIPQYLQAEKRALHAQHDARNALGDSFAGAWLERNRLGDFELVVATTQQSKVQTARKFGNQTRLAQYNIAQLEATVALLDTTARIRTASGRGAVAVDSRIHSWHIDPRSNRVVVTTSPGANDAAKALSASAGADTRMLRFNTSELKPQPAVDVRNADRYNTSNSYCTVGFAVTRGSETGFVTAGHCVLPGAQVFGSPSNISFGTVMASHFPGTDAAWVRNENSTQWTVRPWVNLYGANDLSIIGNIEVPIGAAVCRSGTSSGWRCGTLVARNATVNVGGPRGGLVYGLHESTACGAYGDSGGPFFTTSGEAQGVYAAFNPPVGGTNNCNVSPTRSWHQPLQPVLNAYGLTLQTVPYCGRMTAGRVLTMGQWITSCDGRFVLIMQTDGNLVLYQTGVGALWATHTSLPGNQGANHIAVMQTDGNLVVYNANSQPRWGSGTWGRNGALLALHNDGNLVIYSHLGEVLWTSNTCCR
jgi:hypothetical protein